MRRMGWALGFGDVQEGFSTPTTTHPHQFKLERPQKLSALQVLWSTPCRSRIVPTTLLMTNLCKPMYIAVVGEGRGWEERHESLLGLNEGLAAA